MEAKTEQKSRTHAGWFALAAVAIVVVLFIAWRYSTAPSDNAPALPRLSIAPTQTDDSVQRVVASVEAERQAMAQAKLLQLANIGDEINALTDHLEQEQLAWQSEVLPILENDVGRRIAATPQALTTFDAVYASFEPPAQDLPSQIRSLATTLLKPVRDGLTDSGSAYVPSDELRDELLSLKTQTSEAIESYRSTRAKLLTLVRTAIETEDPGPDAPTLAQALAQIRVDIARREAEAIAAAVAAERERAAEELAAFEAEKARKEAERKLQLELEAERARQLEHERELARQRQEEDRKAREAKMAALRKKAADPAVIERYRPFTDKGHTAFGFDRCQRAYTIRQPVSLKNMREYGILNNYVVFWKTATAVPVRRSVVNDMRDEYGYAGQGNGNDRRTLTGWPDSDAEWANVRKYYQEFMELAPIWVETGVLRP